MEQFCTNDRSLWLDLCRIPLERASIDVELFAPVLYHYSGADLHVLFKMKRILIMGLPGAGKTTLAADLAARLLFDRVLWLNADAVRERFDDWDFTPEGRLRQARRMRELAEEGIAKDRQFVVIDMVAPLKEMRDLIAPDMLVWMDTVQQSKFEDTNRMFEPPEKYNIRITTFDYNVDDIVKELL